MISDTAIIADDVLGAHNNFDSGKSAVNSSGLGKLGEQGGSDSSTRVLQQKIDGAGLKTTTMVLAQAQTQIPCTESSTTVAALNNDLQSLDSEIAMLQQNLRRIQMAMALYQMTWSTTLVICKAVPAIWLDQEIIYKSCTGFIGQHIVLQCMYVYIY